MKSKRAQVIQARPAGPDHRVVSVQGSRGSYRKKPCSNCPWRVDATGQFPAAAFHHSAVTAHDMSRHTFACHQSGVEKPAICAGFLLRGADHNLAVRLKRLRGEILDDVSSGGHELHANYRAMAQANGVQAEHESLTDCRD